MKANLSSQIKLDQIPRRYYDTKDNIEAAALTRDEKIYTRIFETPDDGNEYIARHVARTIKQCVNDKGHCVMALGAGGWQTPTGCIPASSKCAPGAM